MIAFRSISRFSEISKYQPPSACLSGKRVHFLFDEFSSTEKFLTKFYLLLIPESTFPILPTTLLALLCSEVADCV